MATNGSGNGNGGVRVETLKNKEARQSLPALCAEYRRLADESAAIGAAMTALKGAIEESAKKTRAKKIMGDGWMLLRVTRTMRTIKQEKLLEHGVEMKIIEASTEVKTSTGYQVRKGESS